MVSILQHVRDEHTSGSDEMGVKSDLGAVLRGPQCILMFVDFLKLVRFRGPLPHTLLSDARAEHHLYFADELHFLLKPIFKILLSSSGGCPSEAPESEKTRIQQRLRLRNKAQIHHYF